MSQANIDVYVDPQTMTVYTEGAKQFGLSELQVSITSEDQASSAQALIEYLIQYQSETKTLLHSDQTLAYGSWIIKLRLSSKEDPYLDIWELNQEGSAFIPGANFAIQLWNKQKNFSDQQESSFEPPIAHQTVLLSKSVWDGKFPVFGTRYPSNDENRTGWHLYHHANELQNHQLFRDQPLYHLADIRPDLLKVLALPIGSTFAMTKDSIKVGTDPDILKAIKSDK